MKRILTFLLAAIMVVSLWGCGKKVATLETTQPTETQIQETQGQDTPLSFDVQFIRTGGYFEQAQYPQVQIIDSREALDAYYEANKTPYVLEYAEFLEGCQKYDSTFFAENYLIFIVLQESSGSVRHTIHSVVQNENGQIEIPVESRLPGGVGTCDMAQWHIILELERPEQLPAAKEVLVYWNDMLAFEYGQPVQFIHPVMYQAPPSCELRSQSGDLSLKAVNYDWNAQQTDGTVLNTITDLAMRPVSPENVAHCFVDSNSGEIIYGNPHTAWGYGTKLHWDVQPTTISVSCWSTEQIEESFVIASGPFFYAYPGDYIYEIQATWEDESQGFWGNATYYVYITDEEHVHNSATEPQTVDDPIYCTCGNTLTTVHLDGKDYTFMYGHSTTLTDILTNLQYDPMRVCRCRPEFTVDTEFGSGYGINLRQSYVRCEAGQADLTQEQVQTIAQIIHWLQETEGHYEVS